MSPLCPSVRASLQFVSRSWEQGWTSQLYRYKCICFFWKSLFLSLHLNVAAFPKFLLRGSKGTALMGRQWGPCQWEKGTHSASFGQDGSLLLSPSAGRHGPLAAAGWWGNKIIHLGKALGGFPVQLPAQSSVLWDKGRLFSSSLREWRKMAQPLTVTCSKAWLFSWWHSFSLYLVRTLFYQFISVVSYPCWSGVYHEPLGWFLLMKSVGLLSWSTTLPMIKAIPTRALSLVTWPWHRQNHDFSGFIHDLYESGWQQNGDSVCSLWKILPSMLEAN